MRQSIRSAWLLITLIALGACVSPVFHDPITVSTSAAAIEDAELLGPVRIESCSYLIAFFPIFDDPRDMYEALLREARAKGGNAVVDFELRGVGNAFFLLPIYSRFCFEGVGEAALIAKPSD